MNIEKLDNKLKDIEKRFGQLIAPINVLSLGTEEEPFEVEVFRYSVDYDPKEWVSMFASVSRNKKASNNPELRYKLLLTETFAGGPSRPLQLEPVVLNNKDNVLTDDELMYCSNIEEELVIGNRRMVLENPSLKALEMSSDIYEVKKLLETYYVFRIKTSHEMWDRITHDQFINVTTIAQSIRYTKVNGKIDKPIHKYADRPVGVNGLLEKTFVLGKVCFYDYIKTFDGIFSNCDFFKQMKYDHVVKNGVYIYPNNKITIIKKMPKFVADQIATHKTLFKQMTQTTTKEYFIPKDFYERLSKYSGSNKFLNDVRESGDANKEIINGFYTIEVYMDAFKELGYPKEIYQRYPHHTKLITIELSGFLVNWNKFFIERGAIGDEDGKNHTQQCTKDIVKKMYKMYKFIKEEL